MRNDEVSNLADEIAEDVSKLFSENLIKVESRLGNLERKIDEHINNFTIVTVETERMITEKYEELRNKNEENVFKLIGNIQELKEMVNLLRNEVDGLKERGF